MAGSVTVLSLLAAADDIGWKPAVDSWIDKLECADYKPLLTALFSKYIEPTLEHCRRNFKTVVPLPAINQVQTVCKVMWVACGCRRAFRCLMAASCGFGIQKAEAAVTYCSIHAACCRS